MEMLSPGVYIAETDRSQIVTASSSSVGVFGGNFEKGPIQGYTIINNVVDFENVYGKPTAKNYNDWYQVYNYLTYASQIYVCRAGNVNGKFTEIPNCVIKEVGVNVDHVEPQMAKSEIGTATFSGEAGNLIRVNVEEAKDVAKEAIKASNEIAEAVEAGDQGNNIVINVTDGGKVTKDPGVKAKSEGVAEANTAGVAGNSIQVAITNGEEREKDPGAKAKCKYGTAKAVGVEGNKLSVAVTGSEANWTITINHEDDGQLYQKGSISNDAEADLLTNDYIDFTAHEPFTQETVKLQGGANRRTVPTFTVVTSVLGGENAGEKDRQENIERPELLRNNDLVKFTIDLFSVKTVQLQGGVDPIIVNVYTVETKVDNFVKDTQENKESVDTLDDNQWVTFKTGPLEVKEYPLIGGADEEIASGFKITTSMDRQPNIPPSVQICETPQELKDNSFVKFNKELPEFEIKLYEFTGGTAGREPGVDLSKIKVGTLKDVNLNSTIKIGSEANEDAVDGIFKVMNLDTEKKIITLDRSLSDDPEYQPKPGTQVYSAEILLNGSNEAVSDKYTQLATVTDDDGNVTALQIPKLVSDEDLFQYTQQEIIKNPTDFEDRMDSLGFTSPNSKLKFISRNPGDWCKSVKICIAKPESFEQNDTAEVHVPRYAFDGLVVDDFFEYAPVGDQVGILIYDDLKDAVVESFLVSMTPGAKDANNKSMYIETVINNQSQYVFVKVNEACPDDVADYTKRYGRTNLGEVKYIGRTLTLRNSQDSDIQQDDLIDAYNIFANKEEIEIDNIIGNELDGGKTAKDLVTVRKDCIAFIGAEYQDVVNKKSYDAVANLLKWRRIGNVNYNSMFCVAIGNYMQQYDKYSDKNRWVNMAGACAGLRAQTAKNYDTWWASAGLERGQISNVIKLAFNPTEAQRDQLYKNAINPVTTFPGLGTALWGQKTLLSKPSSFDRCNVRCLFNTLERSLAKMAKFKVMEFNDAYTRNAIVSMIKPYLASVQAGRGIQEFLVVCNEANNPPQIIAQNQLVVDVYIRPTYVSEFIKLHFVNSGANAITTETTA